MSLDDFPDIKILNRNHALILGDLGSDTEFLAVKMKDPAGVSEESKLNMDCKTHRHYLPRQQLWN